MRVLWAIYQSILQCLHSTAPIIIALLLKEIHHGGLMMLAVFSFRFFLKYVWYVLVLSSTKYVVYTV